MQFMRFSCWTYGHSLFMSGKKMQKIEKENGIQHYKLQEPSHGNFKVVKTKTNALKDHPLQ